MEMPGVAGRCLDFEGSPFSKDSAAAAESLELGTGSFWVSGRAGGRGALLEKTRSQVIAAMVKMKRRARGRGGIGPVGLGFGAAGLGWV